MMIGGVRREVNSGRDMAIVMWDIRQLIYKCIYSQNRGSLMGGTGIAHRKGGLCLAVGKTGYR